MSKPKNIAPFMADLRALFTTKMLYSYKCSNNNKMNISEYIHKMTTNHSLQQSQFFLSRGNSGRTENNNHKGAELASATVPWHWLFFCLASKVCYKNLPWNFPISFEASKWHWLILASIGALEQSHSCGKLRMYLYHLKRRIQMHSGFCKRKKK